MLPTTVADVIVTKPVPCFTTVTPRLLTPIDQSYPVLSLAALACLLLQQSTNCLRHHSGHYLVVLAGPSQVEPAITAVRCASPHPLNFSMANY